MSSNAPVSSSAGRHLSTVAMQGQLSLGSLVAEGHTKKVNIISVFQPVYLAISAWLSALIQCLPEIMIESLNRDCDSIPANFHSVRILKRAIFFTAVGLLNEYGAWGYWFSGIRFLWASCCTLIQSINSISGNMLFLLQWVPLTPESRNVILKYVFSIVCTNLSWVMFRKNKQTPSWFKSILFHCDEEWSYNSPLFQLLMRIHGRSSGKPLSFKQEPKKVSN